MIFGGKEESCLELVTAPGVRTNLLRLDYLDQGKITEQ